MRQEGWEDRFLEVLERHSRIPFQWGVSDCARLPRDVVEAITGEVPDIWAIDYRDATTAFLKLRALNVNNLGEAFAKVFREIHPVFAGRGDIGTAEYPGAILGGGVVVVGENVMGKGENGVVMLPRTAMIRAFKVE